MRAYDYEFHSDQNVTEAVARMRDAERELRIAKENWLAELVEQASKDIIAKVEHLDSLSDADTTDEKRSEARLQEIQYIVRNAIDAARRGEEKLHVS